MVTANSVPRFKDRSVTMSDSYVEQYMRAKKRHQVSPKCLFGKPCRAETDEFLQQLEVEERNHTKKVFERYDLSEIADGPEKDGIFPKFELDAPASGEVEEGREKKPTESNVKFRPKVVTEHGPPANNLFVPIDKAPSGAVAGVGAEEKLTDYWQTSKRRRSNSNTKNTEELPRDDEK